MKVPDDWGRRSRREREQGGETLFDTMTDLEKARTLLRECHRGPISDEILKGLGRLVEKSQNRETADGSISKDQWHDLRDTVDALTNFIRISNRFMSKAGGW